jgi:hypothetical protein
MAGEDLAINAATTGQEVLNEVFNQTINSVLDKFSPVINLFKVVGVVLLIYILILILKAIINLGTAIRIKKIASNVESINAKLDVLISNTAKKEDKEKKEARKPGFFRRLFGKKEENQKEENKTEEENEIIIPKEDKKKKRKKINRV